MVCAAGAASGHGVGEALGAKLTKLSASELSRTADMAETKDMESRNSAHSDASNLSQSSKSSELWALQNVALISGYFGSHVWNVHVILEHV